MKGIMKYRFLTVGIIVVLAMVLNSCGGGSSYGGGGGGGGVAGPGAFAIMSPSPADGAMGVGATPTFAWTISSGAADYRVEVDTTGTFTGPFVINATVNAATYSYTVSAATLTLGTLYHWRVVAENIYGQAVAGPQTFTP
jgi:mannan endo-1,4-beta-mannosidase